MNLNIIDYINFGIMIASCCWLLFLIIREIFLD